MSSFNASRIAIQRELYRRSFLAFVRAAWSTIEPTRPLLPSVALDALCAALQAFAERRIKRLAISTCPGTGKSLIASVAFPAWLLYRDRGASRVMVGSYSWSFAERDSRRCRELIASPFYQRLVEGRWLIKSEAADTIADYSTTTGGRRLIVSVGGKALGERCTTQILDDVLSGADVHSASAKREASRWLQEVLPSRLEDAENDGRLIIGQRLCVDDPIASAIAQGWSYLYLPAVLAEGDTPCTLLDDRGLIVWKDCRAVGQPLVALLGTAALARLKAELGASAFAAQYLQRPADDTSSILKRSWWRWYKPAHASADAPRPAGCDEQTPAVEMPEHFDSITIAADLTFGGTSASADFASIQAWGAKASGRYLLDHHHAREGFEASCTAIEQMSTAMQERYPGIPIRKLIEKAASGAAVIETLSQRIPGIIPVRPQGPKLARIAAIAPTSESGCCFLPLGWPGAPLFVEECAGATKHDDIPDAAAMAISDLNRSIITNTTSFAPVIFEFESSPLAVVEQTGWSRQ